MAVRTTIENAGIGGRPGTRTIVADALTDVPASQARLSDTLLELNTGNEYTLRRDVLGIQFWSGAAAAAPASPELFVASTGSDAISQPGTLALPLLTPQEAARRHGVTGWTEDAFVTTLDALNLGAAPKLSVPEPQGNARPMTFRGRTTVAIAGVVVTGGSAGTYSGTAIVGASFTSANASAVNSQRGRLLQPATGALVGKRYVIHGNDGAGGFTLPAAFTSGAAPVAGSTFDVLTRDASWTWAGEFMVTGELLLFDFAMLPAAAAKFLAMNAWIQESGMSWTAASFNIDGRGLTWLSGIWTAAALLYLPAGMISCGNRYEGTTSVLTLWTSSSNVQVKNDGNSYQGCNIVPAFPVGNVRVGFQGCTLNDSGLVFGRDSVLYMNLGIRFEAGRLTAASGAVVRMTAASVGNQLSSVEFSGTIAGSDLIKVDAGAKAIVSAIGGAAPAGKFFLNILTGGEALGLATNAATGGTVGLDVSVDGGVAFAVALANALGVVGAQNGSFQHSTDSTAAPGAATINKLAGKSALAAVTGAAGIDITNSLVAVGDHIHLTPIDIDVTAVTYKAVAGAGKFTVTTGANTTAIWKFQWLVVKATV